MNNLTLWSPPARRSLSYRRTSPLGDLDGWLRDVFGTTEWASADFSPAAEVTQDGQDAIVRLELPGIDAEKDATVEIDDGRLVIHGERRDEHTEDADGRSVREVRYGSFRRAFTLPSHVADDAVSAGYDKGVLTVRVAGAYAGAAPKRIPISQ